MFHGAIYLQDKDRMEGLQRRTARIIVDKAVDSLDVLKN